MIKWLETKYARLGFAVAVLAALLMSAIALWGSVDARATGKETAQANHAQLSALTVRLSRLETEPARRTYLVRAHEGMIGVFSADGSILYDLIPAVVSLLPAADRDLLAEGILIHGDDALRALTEDYSS